MTHRTLLATIVALALAPLAAVAAAQPPHPHPPPPEAFEACDDQEEGSACAVQTPHGTLEGTCRAPRGERLLCVPNDPPPRDRGPR